MSITHDTQAPTFTDASAPTSTDVPDRRLLVAGLAAGPVFLGLGLGHASFARVSTGSGTR